MEQCNCKVCTDTRRWAAALNPQTEDAKAVLDEIFGRLEAAETDATYWRMKFDGTWPAGSASTTQENLND